jgi:2',3'-cyclic-nucleotide 2'-phosphodiesterase (5'-nucleotidase family)
MPFLNESGERVGGAAARASLLQRERAGVSRSLTVDAGDVFQGTPYFNFFHGVPDYRAMQLMKYDDIALGNHDLDNGPRAWLRAWNSNSLYLCANVFVDAESSRALGRAEIPPLYKTDDAPPTEHPAARWIGGGRVPATTALTRLATDYDLRGVRGRPVVGLFGLVTSDIAQIVSPRANGGVAVADPISIATRLVPQLREMGADMVVCLSHMGLQADKKLAERVSGIDVIVGGHSHTKLERPILIPNATPNGFHGTVIVQAGSWGEYLGRLAIYLDGKRPVRFAGRLIPVRPSEGEDPDVVAILKPYADSIETSMSRVVFRSPARVSSSGLREGETPLGNFVADAMREAVDADIAIINSGGIRAPIPKGDVTLGDIYSTLPFENRIVVVPMPGWQVRELLDFSGRRIGKGGFGQVSGVSFVIKGARAGYIRVGGDMLESDRVYRVATVDYLYDGGDGYTIFKKTKGAEETGILLRDAALRFLAAHPDYEFRKEGRIVWEGMMRGF